MEVIDLFAGAGGWDVAAHGLGFEPLGFEWDEDCVSTRRAAGLRTALDAPLDIAEVNPLDHAPPGIDGLIASPPCQSYSVAGKGLGKADRPIVEQTILELAAGSDTRALRAADCEDPRSLLTVEPMRWAVALKPRWIACEQVPAVLPLWSIMATALGALGYSVWVGNVSSETFGTPQTRKRALLLASLDREVTAPAATHSRYYSRDPERLDDGVLPWVSMAEALGWGGEDLVGFPRQNDREDSGVTIGGATYRERDLRPASRPAFGLTEKARSWSRFCATNLRPNAAVRSVGAPAPTLAFGHERPRFLGDGGERRVELHEAAVLQDFPSEYPFEGSRTSQFLQLGNAIPCRMAGAALKAVL